MKNRKFQFKFIGNIKPLAVQCLWNSDYYHIGITINLISKDDKETHKLHFISEISYSEYRSKTRMVEEANRISKMYSSKYNIEIYFPSPDDCSRECPNWWNVKSSIKCKKCSTPILSNNIKSRPVDLCIPCNSREVRNLKIINKVLSDDVVTVYLESSELSERIWYSTKFNSNPIAPMLEYAIDRSKFNKLVNCVLIDKSMITNLHMNIEKIIDDDLMGYEPSTNKIRNRFIPNEPIQYKNNEYELSDDFASTYRLIKSHHNTQRAIKESLEYKIYFKKGITHRDSSILKFIYVSEKGESNMNNIVDRYKGILTFDELVKSIDYLITNELIKEYEGEFALTELAMKII